MANPPVAVGGVLALAIAAHYRLRFPVRAGLLLVGSDGRFALPAEGRFDLALARSTAYGGYWARLAFRDRPGPGLLLLRDQFTDSDWRRLKLVLAERV